MKNPISLILLLGFALVRVASASTYADDFPAALSNYVYGGWQGPFGDGTAGRLFPTADGTGIYMDATYNGYVWALRSSPEFSDADMTVRFVLPNRDNTEADWFGLWMLAHNPTTPPGGSCTTVCPFIVPESGLWLQFRVGFNQLVVTRFAGGVAVSSTIVPLPLVALNQPHDARAVYHDGSLIVYLDSVQLLNWPAPDVPAGQVGFEVYRTDMIVDATNIVTPDMAPVLAPIGNQVTSVGTLFTFTASATDADVPAQVLTFSLDAGAPAGATIGASSGVFNWTPPSTGTFPVTVRVTDNGLPPLSAFEAIQIVVCSGCGSPPILATIGNKSIDEQTPLSFTATATDPDAGQTLTFSLAFGVPAATGAAINGTTGAFTWTPTEAQGPSSYSITIRVTDNGGPPLSDSETITVQVNEVNSVPVLASIGDKVATPGVALTFTAAASDGDIPPNVLTFSLDPGAPSGATINASTGTFSWTPGSTGVFPVTIRVSDNGSPPLTDFEAIRITVCSTCGGNQPPVLGAIGNKTVNETQLLTFTATATDPDAGQTLTFSLTLGTPAATGATINGATGAFNWTPTEVQGPGSFPITVGVTDNGSPQLSGTETITVTVNEVNVAPVLAPIGNRVASAGTLLTFTATATDADIPANSLTFSLDPGAPAGATIGTSTGVFNWTPASAGTFPVTIRVTDSGGVVGGTPLSDFEAITIAVDVANQAPVLASIGNKSGTVQVRLSFTATATDPNAGQTLTFSLDAGAPAGATMTPGGIFSWTPACGQNGTFPVTIRVTDNGIPALSDFEAIAITITDVGNPSPVLATIGNKTINEGSLLSFTATATDSDAGDVLTFSLDPGAPNDAAINAASGAFTWTPTEARGPGSYSFTVRVTDNGSCPATDFETITVTVNEVNVAPVITQIGNRTACGPGTPFTFTATATDADIPANTLTFSLDPGAPSGATIGASTGAFSWTPSTFGTFPVTVRVTDNGTPPLSDFMVIAITVSAAGNQAPVLGAIGNKTTNELVPLTFTATATDPFTCPSTVFTFSLDAGAPAGATINGPTGVFTWTPTEAQGPGNFPITVRVSDGGVPVLSDFETITVTVNEFNSAPVLAPIGNKSAVVGTPVTFTATATDSDIPANTLTFSLDAGAPSGATIGATTGAFSWTPTTFGTFPVTIRVTDNGTSPLSDFEAISFFAGGGANQAPVLAAIGNKTVNELTLLAFTATATDPDAGQALTFSLTLGTPAATGATINGSTGAFSWIPTEAQSPGVYPITVSVTDNGSPPQSDFEAITVTINEVNAAPVLAPIGNKTVSVGSLLAFTATAADADIPPNVLTFSLDVGAPAGATIGGSTGAFSWTPSFGQVGVFAITVRVTDNGIPSLSDFEAITVLVIQVDGRPTANAAGPYSGIVNVDIHFDGTGSFDPNGDVLTYAWNFGDGDTGAGATPMHVYTAAGAYSVNLRVTDPGGLFGDAATTATIRSVVSADILLENGGSTLDVRKTGNRSTKIGLEETVLPYTDLIPSTIRISTTFPNSGFVTECAPDLRFFVTGDLNGNGVPDIDIRFSSKCLANLFNNVPDNSVATVVITGQFSESGGLVPLNAQRDLTIRAKHRDQPVMAVAYPNPFNPETDISYTVMKAGPVTMRIYSIDGRLVRTLKQGEPTVAGTHEVTWNGTDDQGRTVASGMYFGKATGKAGGVEESAVLKLVLTK